MHLDDVTDRQGSQQPEHTGADSARSTSRNSAGSGLLGRRGLLKGAGVGSLGVLAAAGLPAAAYADSTNVPPPLDFSQVGALLDPTPQLREVGMERLSNGVLHVAIRTDMHGCTGRMFGWWFLFQPNTQQYIWWHPVDHFSCTWAETQPGTIVGSIAHIDESFNGLPRQQLSVQFRDPTEFFSGAAYANALATGNISVAVCARGGRGWDPLRDSSGAVLGSRLLHLGRDRSWGLELRSHFWLGQDLPALGLSPAQVAAAFPDVVGINLLQHCYNEMTFLSRFLPSLYIGENRNQITVEKPW